MEMNEQEVLDLIAGGSKVVVKVWMDNCPKCDEFKPVFEKVAFQSIEELNDFGKFVSFNLPANTGGNSKFKKDYMKPNVGGNSIGAPAIMVFDKGELLYRHYGKMNDKDLVAFVMNGTAPIDQKEAAKNEIMNLFARRGEITLLMEELPVVDKKIKEIRSFLEAR